MPNETKALPRFDLGLTLAGAISAGAYTAGVVDFLVEALDAWEHGKAQADPDAPQHAVGLKVISGASAGSLTAAILAATLRYDFPHVRQNNTGEGQHNPLYDSWVNMIDIRYLLERRDIVEGRPVPSLLDSTRLLEVAVKAIDYGDGAKLIDRPYLGEPTRFIFTLTNLRGVPFSYTLNSVGQDAQSMSMHGDNIRFALTGLGTVGPSVLRADEYVLEYPAQGQRKWTTWGHPFAIAALASAAFPVGLAPRELTRRVSDYDHIKVLVPGGGGQGARERTISPSWNPVNPRPEGDYRFAIVDGGVINNEPLELARQELCGRDLTVRNDRDGLKAARAVVMIDPFTGPEKPGPQSVSEINLMSAMLSLFSSLKNQARFRPEDVALAIDDTVYSRFLISPVREGDNREKSAYAIACGSLGGFGGFLSQRFREHDFFLGRRNCQRFLERHLTLPEDNPLFNVWTDDQRQRFRQHKIKADGTISHELPIIPLMKAIHPVSGYVETAPAWPKGACHPKSLEKPLKSRLDAIYDAMVQEKMGLLLLLGWKFYLRPKILKNLIKSMESKLKEHALL